MTAGDRPVVPAGEVVGERESFDRSQGRSVVMTRGGIVAAEHPLAAAAGAAILARGGHAADAAIAANAVMGVVAPMMCGIGGDLFAIVHEGATGRRHGLNASGWAPAAASIERLTRAGLTRMPAAGIHAVTVPGAVEGWVALHGRFGRLGLADVLAPAIAIASEGFPVTEVFGASWGWGLPLLQPDSGMDVFYRGGRPPRVGEVFRNPELARSYEQITAGGRDAFYRGEIARRIVAFCERHGGAMQAEDLAEFQSEWVEPISVAYRDWTVSELPPNGQGIAALVMLNLMEQFPLADLGLGSADALHLMIEAKKLAYADLVRYVSDPKFGHVPVAELLAKEYAQRRAKEIDMRRAAAAMPPGQPLDAGEDTTYLAAADRNGNVVSFIQSVYALFGSGLAPDGTGFVLHNRGRSFSLDPAHPNALEGRKRPLHTIIPGFMTRGGTRMAFGIMGGWNQAQAHAQLVSHVVDYGLNIQAALEAPRFSKRSFEGRDVEIEARVPAEVRDALVARGHELQLRGVFSTRMGGGQIVLRDLDAGVSHGASDPRKDGAAIPEQI
jgi:gamma-glutamyltranspeptidase/glutathione hydrolase